MGALLKQTLNKARTLLRCDFEGGGCHYYFWCPGCERFNFYNVGVPNSNGAAWSFSGDFECPSFVPSLRYLGGETGTICHLFLADGVLKYCGDNPHKCNGQSIPLPKLTDEILSKHFWNDFPIEKL